GGELRGAREGHFGILGARRRGDFLVVGGDDDAGDAARALGTTDRARQQRYAGQRAQVLAREAFRSAAGEDEGDDVRRGRIRSCHAILAITCSRLLVSFSTISTSSS